MIERAVINVIIVETILCALALVLLRSLKLPLMHAILGVVALWIVIISALVWGTWIDKP